MRICQPIFKYNDSNYFIISIIPLTQSRLIDRALKYLPVNSLAEPTALKYSQAFHTVGFEHLVSPCLSKKVCIYNIYVQRFAVTLMHVIKQDGLNHLKVPDHKII